MLISASVTTHRHSHPFSICRCLTSESNQKEKVTQHCKVGYQPMSDPYINHASTHQQQEKENDEHNTALLYNPPDPKHRMTPANHHHRPPLRRCICTAATNSITRIRGTLAGLQSSRVCAGGTGGAASAVPPSLPSSSAPAAHRTRSRKPGVTWKNPKTWCVGEDISYICRVGLGFDFA